MSQKLRTALLFIVPIAVIVLLFLFRHMASKTIMNTGYVNGNTGSNLYNNGLFCEHGDTLFFSNPDDGLRLYSMNRDGSDLKRLSDDRVTSINADDHYVYYCRSNAHDQSQFSFLHVDTNSLCRLTQKNGKLLVLRAEREDRILLFFNAGKNVRRSGADAFLPRQRYGFQSFSSPFRVLLRALEILLSGVIVSWL